MQLLSWEETGVQQAKRKKQYDQHLCPTGVLDDDLVLVFDSKYLQFMGKLYTH